jgi:hypothetical protein
VTVDVLAMTLLSNQVVWDVKRFSTLVVQHVSEERCAVFFRGSSNYQEFFISILRILIN